MQFSNYLAGATWAERWALFTGQGLQTALLGIVTVFSVLSLIWGCLEVLKYFMYTVPEQKKNASKAVAEKAPEVAPVPVAPVSPAPVGGNDEIVAAIIAAITAARAEEGAAAGTSFRVVSFRKRK